MKSLLLRTVTGVLFVALLIGGIICGKVTFLALFSLIVALTTWEFSSIVNNYAGASVNRVVNTLAAAVLFFTLAYGILSPLEEGFYVLPYVLALFFLFVGELYLKEPNPLKNWAYAAASHVYIALPFVLLAAIAATFGVRPDAWENYDWRLPLFIFIFLWTNDTGAYLFGSMLSRYIPYKLFPRISPKKSWVGSIGGALLCVVMALLIEHFMLIPLTALEMVGMALVVCIFGTWGDLFESLLKRQLHIKDSGKLLPGHGGMLDRFDSSLLAIPAVYVYLQIILGF